ncbi:MAG: heavy metal-binding domain-containing protein [Polyangiaceae bacterium]
MPNPNEPHAHQHLKLDDLPEHARDRLAGMRERHFFTSDLSVNEFLLVKEARFEPLGLVMGSSIYQIGAQSIRTAVSEELTTLTQAMYTARELAMTRLEEEADALGADGVVAVRLDFNLHAWSANVIEFLAIGTAVKSLEGGFRGADGRPLTSDLSGQDFWTLLNAGYRPLGFVMGNCVYNVGQGAAPASSDNQELTGPTQALYDARELAMERMQVEAEALQAAGIVGVTIDENNHSWGPGVIEFSAVGTAVLPIREDHHIQRPALVLTVGD